MFERSYSLPFKGLGAIFVAVLLLSPTPVEAKPKKQVSKETAPQVERTPYKVAVGDTLDISFFTSANLNQARKIGPDGELFLALIGRVRVEGRTLEDLTKELTERYSEELVSPLITVSVREFSTLQIYVGGEVQVPGVLPFRGGLTAVQAIMNAGGFLKTARKNGVMLIRKGEQNEPIGYLINVKAVLRGQLRDDTILAPADILYIPKTNIANINDVMEQYFRKMSPIPDNFGFIYTPGN